MRPPTHKPTLIGTTVSDSSMRSAALASPSLNTTRNQGSRARASVSSAVCRERTNDTIASIDAAASAPDVGCSRLPSTQLRREESASRTATSCGVSERRGSTVSIAVSSASSRAGAGAWCRCAATSPSRITSSFSAW